MGVGCNSESTTIQVFSTQWSVPKKAYGCTADGSSNAATNALVEGSVYKAKNPTVHSEAYLVLATCLASIA